MSEKPQTKPSRRSAAVETNTAAVIRNPRPWFGWMSSPTLRACFIAGGVLFGPLLLAVAAKWSGATHESGVELAKLVYSWPVMVGIAVILFFIRFAPDVRKLMDRIATIRLPGGGELSITQLDKAEEESQVRTTPPSVPRADKVAMPQDMLLTPEQKGTIRKLIQAERAHAYLWEYRYLTYYLVRSTQTVLDWLASVKEGPSLSLFDSMLSPVIPSPDERQAILAALRRHHLVTDGPLVEVTPKGREYLQWRGPLPPVTT